MAFEKITYEKFDVLGHEQVNAIQDELVKSSNHVDNQNNPHNVTAKQVMVTENVVNAMKQTGNWSVDGILTQLGNTMFGGDVLYQWQKKKAEVVYNGIGSTSYTTIKDSMFTIHYGTGYEVVDDKFSLVNPQTYQGFDYSTAFNSVSYFHFGQSTTIWKRTASSTITKTGVYDQTLGVQTGDKYTVTNAESWTVHVSIEVVTSTDPNAYTDGYVDEDGYTYTALEPITAVVPRIQTGSYTGTGVSGAGSPMQLAFEGTPVLVIINSGVGFGIFECSRLTSDFKEYGYMASTGNSLTAITTNYAKLVGNTLAWYSNCSSGGLPREWSLNDIDKTYYYVAVTR